MNPLHVFSVTSTTDTGGRLSSYTDATPSPTNKIMICRLQSKMLQVSHAQWFSFLSNQLQHHPNKPPPPELKINLPFWRKKWQKRKKLKDFSMTSFNSTNSILLAWYVLQGKWRGVQLNSWRWWGNLAICNYLRGDGGWPRSENGDVWSCFWVGWCRIGQM